MDAWCSFCQDHFPADHYDDSGRHLVGLQYGPEGYLLACVAALRGVAERIGDETSPLAGELRSLIGDELLAKLRA